MRLIGEDGAQIGIVSIKEALAKAEEAGLDLVEISPTAKPPVCRVINFGKFLFEQSKQNKLQKKKSKQIQVKEIKMRPTTDIGDYQTKVKKMLDFLKDGDKVKISIRFRGRELAHQNLGIALLKRVEQDIQEHGTVEQMPKREDRQIIMVVGPKKHK